MCITTEIISYLHIPLSIGVDDLFRVGGAVIQVLYSRIRSRRAIALISTIGYS